MISQNKISNVLATVGAEMEYHLGKEGERKVRDIAGEYFVRAYPKYVDSMAIGNYTYGHLYELGHRGSPRYRLFKVRRVNGNVAVSLRPAKMLVKLSESQKEPGKTGRRVTKRYRFPARPWVYEYGTKVTIRRRTSKRMWTKKTSIVKGEGFMPPIVGPVSYIPRPEYKFKLRESTRFYMARDGRMHMNAAASNYARAAKRSIVSTIRSRYV